MCQKYLFDFSSDFIVSALNTDKYIRQELAMYTIVVFNLSYKYDIGRARLESSHLDLSLFWAAHDLISWPSGKCVGLRNQRPRVDCQGGVGTYLQYFFFFPF